MISTNQELFQTLEKLVNAWCERRCLGALRAILPAYPMNSPLTDSWGELLVAMQNVRAFAGTELPEEEKRRLDECILAVSGMLRNR
jgi:hypothetical protein